MVRFRRKVLLLCIFSFASINLANASGSNIMKITSKHNESDSYSHPRLPKSLPEKSEDDKLGQTSSSSEDLNESFIPYDLKIVVEALTRLNTSAKTQCVKDVRTVLESISRREKWALEMFDASSKFPVGILYGSFYQMGNFDECMEARQPNKHESRMSSIEGQYCLADIELKTKKVNVGRIVRSIEMAKEKSRTVHNSTIHWGICVPSSCSKEEIAVMVKEIFVVATDRNGISVEITSNKCHSNKPLPFTTLEIVYGCLVGLFLIIIFLATAFHYYSIQQRKKIFAYSAETVRSTQNSTLKEVVFCFSVIQTVSKFLRTKPSELNLECISGIKFLSMLFIIGGHTMMHIVGGPVLNTNFYIKESQSLENAIFANSPLLVDTFLLISGFLMSYLLILELDKTKGRINFMVLYVARYIRLTPAYLVVIGLYCSFLFRLGSGPLWDSRIALEQERCLQSWWTNLLYINNYVNTQHLCMFQSWYLAADYHLFIIAPFIIYPMWKWRKLGRSLLGVCILLSVVVPFWITYRNKMDPTFMAFAPEVYDVSRNFYFSHVYIKTHMRAGSYFIGLLFGYLVYRLKASGTKVPRYVILLGWLLSSICGILSMFSIVIFFSPVHKYDALEAGIYAALHRLSWALAIGWVVVACVTENAAMVNKFLSWKVFIPLSRLTYCAYLGNGLIELYSMGTAREGMYTSKFDCGIKIVAHMVFTFAFAFVLCIFFESPIHGLEKILLRKAKRKNQHHSNAETTGGN